MTFIFDDAPEASSLANLIVQESVPVVLMYSQISPAWIHFCHRAGIKVMYRNDSPTAAATRRVAAKKPDVLIATGFDEGGVMPERSIGTFNCPYCR